MVFEPIDGEPIPAHKNCHVVISKPGMIRGNHYHLMGTETIAVVGPALLKFKEAEDIFDVEVPAKQIYKFIAPPKVAHAFKSTSAGDNLLFAFSTHAHDPQNPDAVSAIFIDQ